MYTIPGKSNVLFHQLSKPVVDKTREAEEAAKPSEPPPRFTTMGVLIGGVPHDFEPWEVDRMMEDLLPTIKVRNTSRILAFETHHTACFAAL